VALAGTEPGGRPGVGQLVMTRTEDRVMASPDPSIRQRRVGALMPLGTPNGWLAFTIKAYGDRPMPQEMIEPHAGDKRYVRRGKRGKLTSRQVDVGRSLSADRRSKAKTIVKKGEGDRGDRRSD
jgi:hypothetical protein